MLQIVAIPWQLGNLELDREKKIEELMNLVNEHSLE